MIPLRVVKGDPMRKTTFLLLAAVEMIFSTPTKAEQECYKIIDPNIYQECLKDRNREYISPQIDDNASRKNADDLDILPDQKAATGIKALVGVNFADRHCAHYRIVEQNVLSMMEYFGLNPLDIQGKYKSFTIAYKLKVDRLYDEHPAEFCDLLIETFGPQGKIPDLIEEY